MKPLQKELMSNIRHVGIVVQDLNSQQIFYMQVFNLILVGRKKEQGAYIEQLVGMAGVHLEWSKLRGETGAELELLHYQGYDESPYPRRSLPQPGAMHIAFTVADAAMTAKRIRAAGGMAGDPLQNMEKTVYVLYARDPEGNMLEIVQPLSLSLSLSLRSMDH